MPKVIWEKGRVAALSHTYAIKSPLVTMARPNIAPKSTPSRGPIRKPHYLPHPWARPTYDDAKRHPDPIRRFPQCTGQTKAPTDRSSTGKFDGRCAPRYFDTFLIMLLSNEVLHRYFSTSHSQAPVVSRSNFDGDISQNLPRVDFSSCDQEHFLPSRTGYFADHAVHNSERVAD